jgi:glycosyltransferase involved in cell wall biosynthesis
MDDGPMTVSPRLRIAMMLESDGPGGAEMVVFRLSEELRERGHTIVPVGPADGCGWLGDLFRAAGVSSEVFRLRRPLDPQCVRGLMQVFRKHRINAVHSHEFTMAVYGAAASRMLGLPQVITMHGNYETCKVRRRRIALRWAMRQSDHTVMVSRATQRVFATDLGLAESVTTVVPNGVPVRAGNAERVRKEFGVQPGECVLLAVGTLERRKGHQILLEALSRIEARGTSMPWKLIIAGGRGGDQHQTLQDYVRDRSWTERVHIVTNRNDVSDLLALSEVFVMPSLWEGLPMALLEAMIAGKAIVASSASGIPEAIADGREGLLVPPADVDALAEALHAVLIDPMRRVALGDAAATRARSDFTVQVMADRYEMLYTDASRRRGFPNLNS